MLMGVSLFHTLDKEEFYRLICLVRLLPPKKANELVLDKDDPVDRLFLVLRGEFLLCKKNLSNEIVSFQTYREGHVFGEAWLVRPTLAECAVVAKTEGLLGTPLST
jgi:CRP-like cAMP-binding protein